MRVFDPMTGRSYFSKRRRRYNELGEPRELTFSCFRHFPLLSRDRTREWFRESLDVARKELGFQLWAYVLMPNHVHLLVYPRNSGDRMPAFLQAIKEPVGRKAIAHLRKHAPDWLTRLRVQEGSRVRYRFWQPGGAYDRSITSAATLRYSIDYIHNNPVRLGLVATPEEWEWSSARWFAGIRPIPIEIDSAVLEELSVPRR
jgi:putative transposase